jgi:hypothetical protein
MQASQSNRISKVLRRERVKTLNSLSSLLEGETFPDMRGHRKFTFHKPAWKEQPNGMLQQPEK